MNAKTTITVLVSAAATFACCAALPCHADGGTLGGTLKKLFAPGKAAPQTSERAVNGTMPAPAAAAHCRDGSFSDNPNNHGSCAHHGGVMTKL